MYLSGTDDSRMYYKEGWEKKAQELCLHKQIPSSVPLLPLMGNDVYLCWGPLKCWHGNHYPTPWKILVIGCISSLVITKRNWDICPLKLFPATLIHTTDCNRPLKGAGQWVQRMWWSSHLWCTCYILNGSSSWPSEAHLICLHVILDAGLLTALLPWTSCFLQAYWFWNGTTLLVLINRSKNCPFLRRFISKWCCEYNKTSVEDLNTKFYFE